MKIAVSICVFILVALIVLVLTGKKSVKSELTINASPSEVWRTLTTTQDYPDWNPVMKVLSGELKVGNDVTYQFTQDPETVSSIKARVKAIKDSELLNQGGGIPLVLTFDHYYRLEAKGDQTLMTIEEFYSGIGVNFWDPTPVGEAYERLNQALKTKAEND